ncbi:hypothetical protein LY78DRAFT_106667 [Colletotrichum sublineola]|nr:hypothetical protein LY78DRAFT_106667 [Colletotrichum sublineola]
MDRGSGRIRSVLLPFLFPPLALHTPLLNLLLMVDSPFGLCQNNHRQVTLAARGSDVVAPRMAWVSTYVGLTAFVPTNFSDLYPLDAPVVYLRRLLNCSYKRQVSRHRELDGSAKCAS